MIFIKNLNSNRTSITVLGLLADHFCKNERRVVSFQDDGE